MTEVSMIGLDIAKSVFQAHGADANGHQLFSQRITRAKVLEFFAKQPRCLVALEACGGSHHWARHCQNKLHPICQSGYFAPRSEIHPALFIV